MSSFLFLGFGGMGVYSLTELTTLLQYTYRHKKTVSKDCGNHRKIVDSFFMGALLRIYELEIVSKTKQFTKWQTLAENKTKQNKKTNKQTDKQTTPLPK